MREAAQPFSRSRKPRPQNPQSIPYMSKCGDAYVVECWLVQVCIGYCYIHAIAVCISNTFDDTFWFLQDNCTPGTVIIRVTCKVSMSITNQAHIVEDSAASAVSDNASYSSRSTMTTWRQAINIMRTDRWLIQSHGYAGCTPSDAVRSQQQQQLWRRHCAVL